MKSVVLGLLGLMASTAFAQNAKWEERTLPLPEAGHSAVNWIHYEQRGADRTARVELLRADHFNAEWLSEVTIQVRGSQADGTRQIRLLRQDEGCLSDAVERKVEPSTFCDNLLMSGTDEALQVRFMSADADAAFAFEMRRSADESLTWRKRNRGLRFEPAIAMAAKRVAGDLQVDWRVDGENLSHRNTLTIPAALQRALLLSDAEAALLGYVDLAYAQGDFEGPASIGLESEVLEIHRFEVSKSRQTLTQRDPWGRCTGDQCAPASEGDCADFHCGVCALRPRGISEKQCEATLYSELGEEAPDVHCWLFICWESGEGFDIGGDGGSGSTSSPVFPPFSPPNCSRYDGEHWLAESSELPDLVLNVSQRNYKPIAIYNRQTESIAIINVNIANASCGTKLLASLGRTVFFNQQRYILDDRAWNSHASYRNANGSNNGNCAWDSGIYPNESSLPPSSFGALTPLIVGSNTIPRAICDRHTPAADYPFERDWRAWVQVIVDPDADLPELSDDNNSGYTRNWVRLR